MYKRKRGLIIGFHGCTKQVASEVVNQTKPFIAEFKKHHWLGQGVYFWEDNLERSTQFSRESLERKNLDASGASAVGAVLDLGNCLNLLEKDNLELLKASYLELKANYSSPNEFKKLKNLDIDGSGYPMLRYLDCAVIDNLTRLVREESDWEAAPFDSIRGVFWEGDELYEKCRVQTKEPYSNMCD